MKNVNKEEITIFKNLPSFSEKLSISTALTVPTFQDRFEVFTFQNLSEYFVLSFRVESIESIAEPQFPIKKITPDDREAYTHRVPRGFGV